MDQGMVKQAGSYGFAQTARADLNHPSPGATVAHGDTFAGQITSMDELIMGYQGLLERLTRHCDALVPVHDKDAPNGALRGISPVKDDPRDGPLLFRMQNRNSALYRLQSEIAAQLNRLEIAL